MAHQPLQMQLDSVRLCLALEIRQKAKKIKVNKVTAVILFKYRVREPKAKRNVRRP